MTSRWNIVSAAVAVLAGLEVLLLAAYASTLPLSCTTWWLYIIPWLLTVLIALVGVIAPIFSSISAWRSTPSATPAAVSSRQEATWSSVLFSLVVSVLLIIILVTFGVQSAAACASGVTPLAWGPPLILTSVLMGVLFVFYVGSNLNATSPSVLCSSCCLGEDEASAPACLGTYAGGDSARGLRIGHTIAFGILTLGTIITLALLIQFMNARTSIALLWPRTLLLIIGLGAYSLGSLALAVAAGRLGIVEDAITHAVLAVIAGVACVTVIVLPSVLSDAHGTLWVLYATLFVSSIVFIAIKKQTSADSSVTTARPSLAKVIFA